MQCVEDRSVQELIPEFAIEALVVMRSRDVSPSHSHERMSEINPAAGAAIPIF
jgi:hypothetical protein